jgi:hypothetical protein
MEYMRKEQGTPSAHQGDMDLKFGGIEALGGMPLKLENLHGGGQGACRARMYRGNGRFGHAPNEPHTV